MGTEVRFVLTQWADESSADLEAIEFLTGTAQRKAAEKKARFGHLAGQVVSAARLKDNLVELLDYFRFRRGHSSG